MIGQPRIQSLASRTFASLRAPEMPLVDKDAAYLAQAFARLARTADGQLLRAWLHQNYMLARLPAEATDSALRMQEGARQVPADFENMVKRGERDLADGK